MLEICGITPQMFEELKYHQNYIQYVVETNFPGRKNPLL